MKLAFIDCSTAGVSGDMLTAAMIDAGASAQKAKRAMLTAAKPFGGADIEIKRVSVGGIGATRVEVRTKDRGGRRYVDVVQKLKKVKLLATVKKAAMETLETLARAEAKVHGEKLEKITFHKIGAADAIADIVGCCTAAHELGLLRCKVLASEVAVGRGITSTGHGLAPLPAPATLEILKGLPIRGKAVDAELTTPTGAALLVALADGFVDHFPDMKVKSVGYGAGEKELYDPNIARVFIGETGKRSLSLDDVVVLETNLDDVSGKVIAHAIEKLMAAGALDASAVPIVMKKGRSGFLVRVLAKPKDAERLARLLMLHTGTIGVRFAPTRRYVLEREILQVEATISGKKFKARVKAAREGKKLIGLAAEYEDAKKIAEKTGLGLREIIDRIEKVARKKLAR
jgi:uncharacterized protein (TIGR00299 family) protein